MDKKANKVMIVSGKGGVGKSSLCVTIGRELARMGQRTLLVELQWGLGVFDLLLGVERGVYCLSDYLSGACPAEDCLVPVPGQGALWAMLSPNGEGFAYDPGQFAVKMAALERDFDWILMETPPGFGDWFDAAMAAADQAVLIATPDIPSLREGQAAVRRIKEEKGLRCRLVINRLDEKAFLRRRSIPHLDHAIDLAGAQLLGIVPEDPGLPGFLSEGEALPFQQPARAACGRIVRRMLGEMVALGG